MKSRAVRFLTLGTTLAATLGFVLFVVTYEGLVRDAAQRRMIQHAEVIADALWNYNSTSVSAYLQLAARMDGYARLTVTDDRGRPFQEVRTELSTGGGRLLPAVGLIPRVPLAATVRYNGQPVGRIEAVWYVRTLAVHLYVLFALVLATAVVHLGARMARANTVLERRVAERTAELTRANTSLMAQVAERQRAEAALKVREQQYRELVESANSVILRMDTEGRIRFLNDYGRKLFGYEGSEVMGRSVVGTIVPAVDDDGNEMAPMIRAICRNPEQYAVNENSNIRKDGGRLWITWTNRAIRDESGGVREILCVGNDSTRRKAAEVALREEEARFRALVEAAPLGIALINGQGRLNYVNPRFGEIFGHPAGEVPESAAGLNGLYPDPDYRERMRAGGRENGDPATVARVRTYSIRAADGVEKVVGLRGVPLDGGSHLMIYEDVTEKKRLETALAQARKMEAIGTLAGGIAHDFNNLLMGIQGHVSMMRVGIDSDDPMKDRLDAIEQTVESGSRLTRQLLSVARGRKGGSRTARTQTADVNEIVSVSIEMFGRTRKAVAIHPDLDPAAGTADVDPGQIHQVLLNLYLNAWQALSGTGDIFVSTGIETLDQDFARANEVAPGRYVKIAVRDNGEGMDEGTLARIFEPFFTTRKRGEGTGLGLSSAYGIIRGHDGLIRARSRPGAGATFEIFLPASDQPAASPAPVRPEMVRGGESVLLVDDEEMIRVIGRQLLEGLGYRVEVADCGEAAVDLYRRAEGAIDLVILDLVMPRMDGEMTYRALREIDGRVRVILASGYHLDARVRRILDDGCAAFIQKPFSIETLSVKIREVFDAGTESSE